MHEDAQCQSIAKGNAPIYDEKDKEVKGLKQPLTKYAGYFGKGLETFFSCSKYIIVYQIIILGLLLSFSLVIQKQYFPTRASIAPI